MCVCVCVVSVNPPLVTITVILFFWNFDRFSIGLLLV
jgi:hypothetical protein